MSFSVFFNLKIVAINQAFAKNKLKTQGRTKTYIIHSPTKFNCPWLHCIKAGEKTGVLDAGVLPSRSRSNTTSFGGPSCEQSNPDPLGKS